MFSLVRGTILTNKKPPQPGPRPAFQKTSMQRQTFASGRSAGLAAIIHKVGLAAAAFLQHPVKFPSNQVSTAHKCSTGAGRPLYLSANFKLGRFNWGCHELFKTYFICRSGGQRDCWYRRGISS